MNIHVGNLPKTFKKDALIKLFEAYGKIASATIARDKKTGVSRGFGYVEMVKPDEAEKAIVELNDKEYEGQKLTVSAFPQSWLMRLCRCKWCFTSSDLA